MAKKLRYKPPFGEIESNPSIEKLKNAILNGSLSEWKSRDAMLDFYEEDINHYQGDVSLIIFYDEPYGFFLYYEVSIVPIKLGVLLKDDIVVEHPMGGVPMRVPSICYRTREEAWEIIEYFIRTEKPIDKYNWVMLDDIDYER